jgi:hypothetical protein
MPLHTKPKPHKAPSVLDTFDPDRDAPDAVITPSGEDAVAATFEDTGDDDTWGEDDTAEMSFFRSGDARDRLVQSGKELSKAPKAKALQMALDLVVELVPCEAASIATGSADDPHLTYAVASGPVAKQIIGRSVDWGEGLVGLCFECGIPVEIDDVSRDDRHLRQFDDRTGFRTRSMLCVPVRDAQTTYGVIQLVNLRWATDDNTVASVQGLAKNLASALAPR